MSILSKQVAALKLAIKVLKEDRRRHHAAGEAAYNQGILKDVIDEDGVTHVGFAFAVEGHKGYIEYTAAIGELEDMLEALKDADVKIMKQPELFEEEE